MGGQEILLDRQVRDWVMLPLTFAVFMMRILTQYVHQIFLGADDPVTDKEKLTQQQHLKRAGRLRQMGHYLPPEAFHVRKAFFVAKEGGVFQAKPEKQDMMATDPSALMGPMKRQVFGIIPQIAMGALVNYFFDGFVVGKVPFPLSPRFRPMLQRGIDLAALDVSYFTSLSFYIMLLFSLRGVLALFFHDSVVDETEMMRRQMAGGMAGGPMQPGFDAAKAFDQERGALEVVDHKWKLKYSEERAIEVLREKLKSA